MLLFSFVRPEPNPIKEDNHLTKSLRLNQAQNLGSLVEADDFDITSHTPMPFIYEKDSVGHVHNYADILINPDSFRKSPGR